MTNGLRNRVVSCKDSRSDGSTRCSVLPTMLKTMPKILLAAWLGPEKALPREARKEMKSWMCVSETESLIVKMIEDKVVCHGIVVSRAVVTYIFILFNPQHFDIWNDFEVFISSGFCSYGSEFCEPILLRHFSWIWYLVRKWMLHCVPFCTFLVVCEIKSSLVVLVWVS